MEAIETLGTILPEGHSFNRDAVHVAIVPVIAGEDLRPGCRLRMVYGTTNTVINGDSNHDAIGIADPFIRGWRIEKGQKFWMWLNPGTITGLRHDWTHPAFDGQRATTTEAEKWLREFACKWNFDYDEMIAAAIGDEDDAYVVARGIDLHSATELDPGDEDRFWSCIEAIHGTTASDERRQKFSWSCSC